MSPLSPECSLCIALSSEGQKNNYNKILYESTNFVAIPSLGPLTLGHILIVSKYHFESLAQMGKDKIIECRSFLEKLIGIKGPQEDLLIFEHGSYDNQKGGGCVTHTHIHIIPKFGIYFNILDNILKTAPVISFNELGNVDFPYILSINNTGFRVYEAYNVHSQMMRKTICWKLKLTQWDWRKNDNKPLIKLSMDYWNDNNQNGK